MSDQTFRPTGYIRQAMIGHLPATLHPELEVLRQVVSQLSADARRRLDEAAHRVQTSRGQLDDADLACLADAARVCIPGWAEHHASIGLTQSAGLNAMLTLQGFKVTIQQALAGDEAALRKVAAASSLVPNLGQPQAAQTAEAAKPIMATAAGAQPGRPERVSNVLASTQKPAERPTRAESKAERRRRLMEQPKLRFRGSSAAFVVELDQVRDEAASGIGRSEATYTLRVEGAPIDASGEADWQRKISLQITALEFPEFAAVVHGMRPEFKFTNHGVDRNKKLEGHAKGDRLVLTIAQGKASCTAPVGIREQFYLGMLCQEVLSRNHRGNISGALHMLRCLRASD